MAQGWRVTYTHAPVRRNRLWTIRHTWHGVNAMGIVRTLRGLGTDDKNLSMFSARQTIAGLTTQDVSATIEISFFFSDIFQPTFVFAAVTGTQRANRTRARHPEQTGHTN